MCLYEKVKTTAYTCANDKQEQKRLLNQKNVLECVSKIPEYAISGVAAPFLRHKARLSAAKPSGFFLELTQNPLGSADCSA